MPTLMWKPQRVSSQRHPPRRLRPPARSALWHTAYFLLPRCAWRSRKSSGRPPSRRTRCRRARPHDTLILCHGPAVHRGYDQAAPHALLERAARRLDQAGAGRTASPSEATPSLQLRDTTACGIQSDISALVERILWPGLSASPCLRRRCLPASPLFASSPWPPSPPLDARRKLLI